MEALLANDAHRPWPTPECRWQYYQEWNNALFLHWSIAKEKLIPLVPKELPLDTYDGMAYISLVAFTMEQVRPRGLPSVKYISFFEEINVRTYIDRDGNKGVHFLSIEAGKTLSAFIARSLSALPYERSIIHRKEGQVTSRHRSGRKKLDTHYVVGGPLEEKDALDIWLTERYCLYYMDRGIARLYEVHHEEWPLYNVELRSLDVAFDLANDISLRHPPERVHYSPGVKVLSWPSVKCRDNG